MIQGNPDFLAKLMAELEAEKALSVGANDLVQMPQSMIGTQPQAGGMNQQALQASMQGGAPDGFMAGNMPDPSAPINNIPQELSNMGYTPPPAQTGQMQEMLGKAASFTPEAIEHHPLVQSTAQYVPLPTSEFNPYAPVSGELGLMELLAQSQQMG
jgi:hypothetical protein